MKCACCGKNNFSNLITFNRFPLINSVINYNNNFNNKFYKLSYSYCKFCYFVIITSRKNKKLIDKFYEKNYSYFSPLLNKDINFSRDDYFLKKVTPWINKKKLSKNIFEIGGYDGYILKNLKKYFLYHEGFDPSEGADIGKKNGVNIKKKFFNSKNLPKKKFELIITRHVIEHIHNLDTFIKNIRKIMFKDTILIIETPNFEYFINKNKTECFSYQHVSCFNYIAISNLFSKHNLICFKKYLGENMILFFKMKENHNIPSKKFKNLSYNNFQKNIKIYENKVKLLISQNLIQHKKYAIWGTGGYAHSIIYNYNLDTNQISFFIDNNLKNIKKRIYGINKPIYHSKKIKAKLEQLDFILIASMYYKDILIQIKKFGLPIKILILPNKKININLKK